MNNRIFQIKLSCRIVLFFILIFFHFHNQGYGLVVEKKHLIESKGDNYIDTIQFELKNGLIILCNVFISHSGPYRFVLDNCSTYCSISPEIALSVDFIPKRSSELSDGIHKNQVLLGKVDVTIDNIYFKNILTDCSDLHHIYDRVDCHVDGIIGMSLMKDCVWTFAENFLIIAGSLNKLKDINQYEKRDFSFNRLLYSTKISTVEPVTILDLGMNFFGEINPWYLRYIEQKEILTGKGNPLTRAFSEDNQTGTTRMVWFPIVDIGGVKIRNAVFQITEEEDSLSCSVGAQLLDYFNMILDCKKENIYLKPKILDTYFLSDENYQYGFLYRIIDSSIYITTVWDNSPAFINQLEVGDKIVNINGLDLRNIMEYCVVYQLINKELRGPKIVIGIEGKADVTLHKSVLFMK